MHNAAYAALGLDYVYVPFRAPRKRLREAIRGMRSLGVVGFNVTVPYKEDAARIVDRLTDTAAAIGAVNTVFAQGEEIVGDNTDAEGFHQALLAHSFRPRGKRVLVIGAGGSARAVLYSLVRDGSREIVLANRTVAKARRLMRELGGNNALRVTGLDALTDTDLLAGCDLVVNCTPVGLKGGAFLGYSAAATPARCVHFDLAYGRALTPFLQLARRARRPVIDGRHMLVHQGAVAFRRFTNKRAPVGVMLTAVGGAQASTGVGRRSSR